MKLFFLILFFSLLIVKISFAQVYHATDIYCGGGISNYSTATKVITDDGGNTYLAGFYQGTYSIGIHSITSSAINSTQNSIFLAKLNKRDSVIWLINVADEVTAITQQLNIICDKQGSIIFTHYFIDTLFSFGNNIVSEGYSDIIIEKINSNGLLKWYKTINGKYDERTFNNGVQIDSSNNIFITGFFGSTSTPYPLDSASFNGTILSNVGGDYFLAKYDSSGNLIWTRKASDPNYGAGGNNIIFSDFGFYITGGYGYFYPMGNFQNIPSNVPTGSYNSCFLASYKPNGKIKWIRAMYTPGFADRLVYTNQTILKNGNIVVYGGYSSSHTVIVQGHPLLPANSSTSASSASVTFVICYDTIGNVVWVKNPNGFLMDVSGNVNADISSNKKNNELYLLSSFNGATLSGNDTVFAPTNGEQTLLECLDSMGNTTWHKLITGNGNPIGIDMTVAPNNDILVLGNTTNDTISCDTITTTINNTQALYVVRFTEGALHQPNGVESLSKVNVVLEVYPNPTKESLVISSKSLVKQIEVIDILGRVMLSEREISPTNILRLTTANLPSGIYFIKATDEKGFQYTAKFVKE